MTTRVHLADDHTMFREGLQTILSSQEVIEVVGTSSTGLWRIALPRTPVNRGITAASGYRFLK